MQKGPEHSAPPQISSNHPHLKPCPITTHPSNNHPPPNSRSQIEKIIYLPPCQSLTAKTFPARFEIAAFHLSNGFFLGLGAATLVAMYDYSGYFNICLIGSEVKDPSRNIPRCILLSISFLAVCYSAMSISIIGVLPWREAAASRTVFSDFVARVSGPQSARFMTILILIAAFGSVYSVLLGYSRVPYAAAAEGKFFAIFARLHGSKQFPWFSVLTMGLTSAVACLLSLSALIKSLVVLQVLTQFMAQCISVILIRRSRRDIPRPFSMWLYPLPVVVALFGWIFILASSGAEYVLAGAASVVAGFVIFLLWARHRGEWPFRLTAH